MRNPGIGHPEVLNLKAGDWVEVRSREEILSTLDERGRLDNLPFMPEMLEYCGQRLRVYKRADKTCEYTQGWSIRRMTNTVHLEGVRCDGSGHDGCQAGCLIFWKEAWLKRTENGMVRLESLGGAPAIPASFNGLITVENLLAASRTNSSEGDTIYNCQATDVPKFTAYMSFWDPRQYIRDLRSGNLKSGLEGDLRGHRVLEFILNVLRLLQTSIIGLFNQVQSRRQGKHYPFIEGDSTKASVELLDLQPGELVEVRSKEEIIATLGKDQKNRGLWFDSEMLPYCGGIYRVLRRVHKIIDEKTGKLITMKNSCIVLEGVVCRSDFHRLCPRAIYPYWREGWLKRASNATASRSSDHLVATCKN
ncbi:MAG TPA: hypothetical protein VIH89_00525 [Candidatus Sulfotelmatobacter sp.]